MERANAVLQHKLFVSAFNRLEAHEKGRGFCGHGMEHLLDVARIAHILNLESGSLFPKEIVYATALLHDIGRAKQYEDGTPHEQESAMIAKQILPDCGFDDEETKLILDAILSHRNGNSGEKMGFAGLIYRADKLSRRCFHCAAQADCYLTKRNTRLEY